MPVHGGPSGSIPTDSNSTLRIACGDSSSSAGASGSSARQSSGQAARCSDSTVDAPSSAISRPRNRGCSAQRLDQFRRVGARLEQPGQAVDGQFGSTRPGDGGEDLLAAGRRAGFGEQPDGREVGADPVGVGQPVPGRRARTAGLVIRRSPTTGSSRFGAAGAIGGLRGEGHEPVRELPPHLGHHLVGARRASGRAGRSAPVPRCAPSRADARREVSKWNCSPQAAGPWRQAWFG